MKTTTQPRGLSYLDYVLIILFVAVVVAVLYPVLIPVHHEETRKEFCQNNLKQLGLAFSMYERDYNGFPHPLGRSA